MFQTGIFVEWKAPYVPLTNITESRIPGVESRQDCLGFPNIGRNKDFSKKTPVFFPPREGGGVLPFLSHIGKCRFGQLRELRESFESFSLKRVRKKEKYANCDIFWSENRVRRTKNCQKCPPPPPLHILSTSLFQAFR